MKHQTPSSKLQLNTKIQASNTRVSLRTKRSLEFVVWSFFGFWILVFGVLPATAAPVERSTNDFVFIDNGELRLGVKKSSGAGIAFLAMSATGRT